MLVTNLNLYHTKLNHKTYFMKIYMPILWWHVYFYFIIVSETAVLVFRNEFLRTVDLTVCIMPWLIRTVWEHPIFPDLDFMEIVIELVCCAIQIVFIIFTHFWQHTGDFISSFRNTWLTWITEWVLVQETRVWSTLLIKYRFKIVYSPFMSYRTRFSQVFSYIIELRKKNIR